MLRDLLFWWYVSPLMVRHQLGRWYVFRDCPTWVVQELADMQEIDDGKESDVSSFFQEATDELHRRNTWKR